MILPEVRVRLVCLHHFRGQEQEDPDTVCVSVSLNTSRTSMAYLAPITEVLLLSTNFSNNVYTPPGIVPKAAAWSA
jgi:hypothetical protein